MSTRSLGDLVRSALKGRGDKHAEGVTDDVLSRCSTLANWRTSRLSSPEIRRITPTRAEHGRDTNSDECSLSRRCSANSLSGSTTSLTGSVCSPTFRRMSTPNLSEMASGLPALCEGGLHNVRHEWARRASQTCRDIFSTGTRLGLSDMMDGNNNLTALEAWADDDWQAPETGLDQLKLDVHISAAGVQTEGLIFTSRPISVLYSKRAFQIYLSYFVVFFLLAVRQNFVTLHREATMRYPRWRLGHTELGSDAHELVLLGRGGNVLSYTKLSVPGDGLEVVWEGGGATPIVDQWCVKSKQDVVGSFRGILSAADWGADAQFQKVSATAQFIDVTSRGTYTAAWVKSSKDTECFSLSPSRAYIMLLNVVFSILAVSYCVETWLSAYCKWYSLAHAMHCGHLYTLCVLFLGSSLYAYAWVGEPEAGRDFLEKGVMIVARIYVWVFREQDFLPAMISMALWGTAQEIYALCVGEGGKFQTVAGVALDMMYFGTLASSLWILYFRKKTVREAHELVAGDQERYDKVWAALFERELLGIQRICEVVKRSGVSADRVTAPRQLNEEGKPERSLDVIYRDAKECNMELKDRVREWAQVCGGMLFRKSAGKAEGDKKFVRVERRSAEEFHPLAPNKKIPERCRNGEDIHWCRVKSPSRAIEKIYRVYEGDSSWLVDLSRQSIIFDDALTLSRCLDIILHDPDVHVERVKCRYCPGYDSSLTCGYRDVALNVRLGGRRHVCELQLILKDFALLKEEEGHSRYVRFRNLRGL